MKFCSQCGFQNKDEAKFCQSCGAPFDAPIPVQQEKAPAQPPRIAAEEAPSMMNMLKRMYTSPTALIAIILYTVGAAFSFIYSLCTMPAWQEMLDHPINNGDYISVIFSTFFSFSMPSQILTALIIAGMWMIYVSAASRRNKEIATTGFTIIKVTLVISLVYFCMAMALLEFILFIACFFTGIFFIETGMESIVFSSVMFAVTTLVLVITLVLSILFYVKSMKTVDAMKNTILTGVPSDETSAFVAVMMIISGVSLVLYSFQIDSLFKASWSPIFFLASLCSGVASMMFGVFLTSYRNKMRILMIERQKRLQQEGR